MVKKDIVVDMIPDGEISAAALVVQRAGKYSSQIYIETKDKRINAKSIMGMMTLSLDSGKLMTVTAEGADEEDALKDICEYLEK